MWKSKQLEEVDLSFHHVDPQNQTEVIKFGSKHLHLLRHLSTLESLLLFLKKKKLEIGSQYVALAGLEPTI